MEAAASATTQVTTTGGESEEDDDEDDGDDSSSVHKISVETTPWWHERRNPKVLPILALCHKYNERVLLWDGLYASEPE